MVDAPRTHSLTLASDLDRILSDEQLPAALSERAFHYAGAIAFRLLNRETGSSFRKTNELVTCHTCHSGAQTS